MEVGPVYKPLELSIVPPPDTLHANVAVGSLARNALNCACSPTGTLTVPGNTAIGPVALGVGVGGPGVVLVLPPPQPDRKSSPATTAAGTSRPI